MKLAWKIWKTTIHHTHVKILLEDCNVKPLKENHEIYYTISAEAEIMKWGNIEQSRMELSETREKQTLYS